MPAIHVTQYMLRTLYRKIQAGDDNDDNDDDGAMVTTMTMMMMMCTRLMGAGTPANPP